MRTVLFSSEWRKGCRRAVQTVCQCVTSEDFRLLGTEVLDLSPHGMLIRGEDSADIGAEVILSFQAPGGDEWFDAVARVARIIGG